MAELPPLVQAVADQTTQATLQAAQQAAALQMQNAVQMQQLAQTAALQALTGGLQVHQSYQGNHLRRGSEVDAQESVAEGQIYKGESESDLAAKITELSAALSSVMQQVKVAQTTPPQSGGHAAQPPAERVVAQ